MSIRLFIRTSFNDNSKDMLLQHPVFAVWNRAEYSRPIIKKQKKCPSILSNNFDKIFLKLFPLVWRWTWSIVLLKKKYREIIFELNLSGNRRDVATTNGQDQWRIHAKTIYLINYGKTWRSHKGNSKNKIIQKWNSLGQNFSINLFSLFSLFHRVNFVKSIRRKPVNW